MAHPDGQCIICSTRTWQRTVNMRVDQYRMLLSLARPIRQPHYNIAQPHVCLVEPTSHHVKTMAPITLLAPNLALECAVWRSGDEGVTLRLEGGGLVDHPCVTKGMFTRADCAIADGLREMPCMTKDGRFGDLGEARNGVMSEDRWADISGLLLLREEVSGKRVIEQLAPAEPAGRILETCNSHGCGTIVSTRVV